jgi:hypothetical protein
MEVDSQRVIDDLLEQNKQMTLQLAIARGVIAQLQEALAAYQSAAVAEEKTAKKA